MSRPAYHLVHANVAIARASLGDPVMASFIAQVDEISSLAKCSSGFVEQPVLPDSGEVFKGNVLLNVSLWKSVEDLNNFTHQGRHALALQRRADWFEQSEKVNYVLFWQPAGEFTSERKVQLRIEYLRVYGPTPYAFNFKQTFTIEDILSYEPLELGGLAGGLPLG